jgi:mRNA-degrading endonuclease toxin of MazEF toxin-antitoxin module
MILTRDADLGSGEPLQVVAITKSIGENPPAYWVPVPHGRPAHPVTGLFEPSVAKCNWIREVEERRVIKGLGDMPDDEFERILDWIDRLEAAPDFDDWI